RDVAWRIIRLLACAPEESEAEDGRDADCRQGAAQGEAGPVDFRFHETSPTTRTSRRFDCLSFASGLRPATAGNCDRNRQGVGKESLGLAAGPAFGHKAVAHPRFRLDVLAAGFVLKFLAQLPHENAEIFRLICRLGSPD